jgi:hypothetical protein
MNNVVKFRKKPEEPRRPQSQQPRKARNLTWQPWVIFLAVALGYYALQRLGILGA